MPGFFGRKKGVQRQTPATTNYAEAGLLVGTYSYTVAARDAAGNLSPDSTSASITLADTTPPTTPTGLTAAAAGSNGAHPSRGAFADHLGGTGFILRPQCGPVAKAAPNRLCH